MLKIHVTLFNFCYIYYSISKFWFLHGTKVKKISPNITHFLLYKRVNVAAVLPLPARIFPIYFPIGNMATGFFVILALLAGVVGFTTSLTGLHNVFQWNGPNLHAAAASSLVTWALTLLAMG